MNDWTEMSRFHSLTTSGAVHLEEPLFRKPLLTYSLAHVDSMD